jgi:hypothetical protein
VVVVAPFQLPDAFCSTGAAEGGRAPTEERSCVRGSDFCSAESA